MSRPYALGGLRRISPATRQGRPLCPNALPYGRGLYCYIGCALCSGTGGVGAPPNAPVGPEAVGSLAGG